MTMTDDQILERAAEIARQNPKVAKRIAEAVARRNLHTVRLTAQRDRGLARLREFRPAIERLAQGDAKGCTVHLVAALACFALAEMNASEIDAQIGEESQ